MREVNRRNSLYFLLVKLLTVSMAAAVVFYALLSLVSDYAVSRYYNGSAYVDRRDSQYLESLQEYVKENQVKTTDTAKISRWVSRQKVVFIQIYRDNVLMYDSNHSDLEELWEEQVEQVYYDWESYYQVTFADGDAEVVIYGTYEYQLYNYAMICDLLLAFLLFMTLVILGIRKKMAYIRLLSQEIEILEGGNLEYPITVQGRDELAELAGSLEAMRKSIRTQADREKQLTQANQRMVTEMSHDLRTPLTSIFIFTEILRHKCRDCAPQLEEYVEKIDQKAQRLKQLSDHLFEYALITSETKTQLDPATSFQAALFDVLSEMAAFLQQQGYTVDLALTWEPRTIRVSGDYIARISDNLVSNFLKYADPAFPISIRTEYDGTWASLVLENRARPVSPQVESTKIGLHNIRAMMQNMAGRCDIETEADRFRLALRFPCLPPRLESGPA